MSSALIGHMVGRFLQWPLPVASMSPDGGISIKPGSLPFGTNLLDAKTATEMVEFMLEGTDPVSGEPVADYKPKFAAGDIVALKGGGPQMTILVPDAEKTAAVYCVWFQHTGFSWEGPFRESFNKDALVAADALPPAPDGGC